MSTERVEKHPPDPREELQQLIDELPDDQIRAAVNSVRNLANLPPKSRPASERPWPPPWFGSITSNGRGTAAGMDEVLAEGFGQ
jgi:hypothetical protein